MALECSRQDHPERQGQPARQTRRRRTALHGWPTLGTEADRLRHLGTPNRRRSQRHVPGTQYSVNGERRSFALLRPIIDATAQDRVRDLILEAFTTYEEQESTRDAVRA